MPFVPPIAIGDVITNGQLSDMFKVGNMGGMRRSKATNTLVLAVQKFCSVIRSFCR